MSKTNVKIVEKPTYIIKPKEGIIVCKITARSGNMYFFSDMIFCNSKLLKKYNIRYIDEQKTFTAVAKLHKGDEWDEIKGKRIAESKCKRKMYNFYSKFYIDMFKIALRTNITSLAKWSNNLYDCAIREDNHLKELMHNENNH